MLKESLLGIENIKEIEVLPLKQVKEQESYLYDSVNKITGDKVPLIPLVVGDKLTMEEIKLDEEFTLNETLEITNYDNWSDFKNKFININLDNIKRKHFNKILAKELNKVVGAAATTKDLLVEQKVNNTYWICVNDADFKKLLKEVNEAGEKATKKVNGKFYYYDVEIIVLPDLLKPTMLDLNELIVREIIDTKEIQNDASLIRQGKRASNIQGYYGLALINPTNIYSVK